MLEGVGETTKNWKSGCIIIIIVVVVVIIIIIIIIIIIAIQREMAFMSIKQAFLKSNESSLNKKNGVLEIDVH